MVLMDCISISHTHVFLSAVFGVFHKALTVWIHIFPLITCNKIAFT